VPPQFPPPAASPPPSPRSPPASRSAQHLPVAQRGPLIGLLARRRLQSLTRGPHMSFATSRRRRSNPLRDRAGGRVRLGVRAPAAFSLGPACQDVAPAYLRRRPPAAPPPPRRSNPSARRRRRSQTLAGRRFGSACPPPVRRLRGHRQFCRAVRNPQVSFVLVFVPGVAESRSPASPRCVRSPSAALEPHRRCESSPSSSHVRARCSGEIPAADGAPQFPRRAAARRRSATSPRVAAG
jgi:hypothetical protein